MVGARVARRLRRRRVRRRARRARPLSRTARSRPTRRSSASPGALIGGMLFGAVLEALGYGLRRRVTAPALGMVDGLVGAVLSAGVALGLAWIAGAVALQTPQARGLRDDIQRSSILRALNDVLPPSGPILNALARFDPFPRIDGPPADVPAPRRGDRARSATCAARGPRRGQDPGDGVRPGRRGLGLGRPRRARGDQRARRRRPGRHDGPARRRRAAARRRTPSPSTPHDDIAVLRVDGLRRAAR